MTSDDAKSPEEMKPTMNTSHASQVTGFNLKTAAELAGVSVSTMRRRRSELLKYGATVTEDGIWNIPITALEAAGLMQRTNPDPVREVGKETAQKAAPPQPEEVKASGVLTEALERIQELEREVLEHRHRAELAEVRLEAAEQRARAAEVLAEDRRKTLEVERRMLPPGPSSYAHSVPSRSLVPEAEQSATPRVGEQVPNTSITSQEVGRPSWWRRTFG